MRKRQPLHVIVPVILLTLKLAFAVHTVVAQTDTFAHSHSVEISVVQAEYKTSKADDLLLFR